MRPPVDQADFPKPRFEVLEKPLRFDEPTRLSWSVKALIAVFVALALVLAFTGSHP